MLCIMLNCKMFSIKHKVIIIVNFCCIRQRATIRRSGEEGSLISKCLFKVVASDLVIRNGRTMTMLQRKIFFSFQNFQYTRYASFNQLWCCTMSISIYMFEFLKREIVFHNWFWKNNLSENFWKSLTSSLFGVLFWLALCLESFFD